MLLDSLVVSGDVPIDLIDYRPILSLPVLWTPDKPLSPEGRSNAIWRGMGYGSRLLCYLTVSTLHDDVIKWKHFPRYWPSVRRIHRSPVNSPHKGQWCGALMFSLICTGINGWVNNGEAGDLRRHRAHYDFTVMFIKRISVVRLVLIIVNQPLFC